MAEAKESSSKTIVSSENIVTKCSENTIAEVKQEKCCANDFYDLLKGLSASLAWPIVVLIVFIFLRDRISKILDYVVELIPSTTKFSAGGDGFVWERSIESIKVEAEKIDHLNRRHRDPSTEANYSLAKIYPRGAIIEAWNSVQANMFRFASHNITIDTEGLQRRLPEELLKKGSITKEQYSKLRELFVARNQAVHGLITPTTEDAIAYLKVASEMNIVIKELDSKSSR